MTRKVCVALGQWDGLENPVPLLRSQENALDSGVQSLHAAVELHCAPVCLKVQCDLR